MNNKNLVFISSVIGSCLGILIARLNINDFFMSFIFSISFICLISLLDRIKWNWRKNAIIIDLLILTAYFILISFVIGLSYIILTYIIKSINIPIVRRSLPTFVAINLCLFKKEWIQSNIILTLERFGFLNK